MDARTVVLAAAFAVGGCGTGEPPPVPRPPPPPPQIVLELANVTPLEVVERLGRVTHHAIHVLPDADTRAACARVSISVGPVPEAELVGPVDAALAASGLEVETGAQWVLRVRPDAPLLASVCPPAGGAPSGPEPLPPGNRPEPDAPPGQASPAFAAGVQIVGPTERTVTRAAVDELAARQDVLMASARVIPYQEGGHVVGVRLYGIRAQSVAGVLGLQNGDTLLRVNGLPVADPAGALQAYSALHDARRVDVEILRAGQPLTLVYRVGG